MHLQQTLRASCPHAKMRKSGSKQSHDCAPEEPTTGPAQDDADWATVAAVLPAAATACRLKMEAVRGCGTQASSACWNIFRRQPVCPPLEDRLQNIGGAADRKAQQSDCSTLPVLAGTRAKRSNSKAEAVRKHVNCWIEHAIRSRKRCQVPLRQSSGKRRGSAKSVDRRSHGGDSGKRCAKRGHSRGPREPTHWDAANGK
mmetsp:Transcript_12324/g.27298  ORF Transcript_12324/g.27298 Transcript_12324/m.27298 type:complete len:200 (-) Transcript_12324:811-1410(-)